ncbi:MAG: tRNA modification GTPase MnmE [Planctomycetota bacterium]
MADMSQRVKSALTEAGSGGDPQGNRLVRVALLTPKGRGALAVIGVAGPAACELADRLFAAHGGRPLAARADGSLCVGRWHGQHGLEAAGEELVVVRRSAESLEIHCHGGLAAPEAVLASLEAVGAIRQSWQTWVSEATESEVDREARLLLSGVAGPRNARILARQLAGCLEREIERIAGLEPGPDRAAAAERLLRASRVGLRLAEPWRVVLAGPVNAGKSSLVNALAGHARSIVSAEPGTTRDLVTTRVVLGGWEIDLVDAAGLRPDDAETSATERAGIARALAAAAGADLVIRVEAFEAGEAASTPAGDGELRAVTKRDLAPENWQPSSDLVATSAVTGSGIAELAAAIVARLVPEEQEDPELLAGPVPFTSRQVELLQRLGTIDPGTRWGDQSLESSGCPRQ